MEKPCSNCDGTGYVDAFYEGGACTEICPTCQGYGEMEEPVYLIFSISMAGWLTKTATYSSDTEDAKRFSRDEAIAACQGHMDARSRGFGWLPVYEKDLDAIRGRK